VSQRKIGLDIVRAAAISLVLAAHFIFEYTRYSSPGTDVRVASVLFGFATLGVEIFFVLSGYLIGGILLKSIKNNDNRPTPSLIAGFWYRRWMRTLPNYVLFLTVYTLLTPTAVGLRGFARYLLFAQNLKKPMVGSFFVVSWSLAVEEWFYLTLPILIYVFYRLSRRVRGAFLGAVTFLLIVPMVLRLTLPLGVPWDSWIRKVVVLRLDSLMWGVLVAALERYRNPIFRQFTRPWICGVGVMTAVAATAYVVSRLDDGSGEFRTRRPDLFVLPVMNIGCALALPFFSVLQSPRGWPAWVITRISLWSYSLYLSHLAVMMVVEKHLGHWPLHLRGMVALGGAFAVSALVYHAFEAPILRLRDRKRGAPEVRGLAVVS
jgi:peptidoglycan/LPS O-acetylase OafA/YrhL